MFLYKYVFLIVPRTLGFHRVQPLEFEANMFFTSAFEPLTVDCLAGSTVGRGRQKTIVLKVPAPEESQEEQDSGSEASDTLSNGGQSSGQNTNNVTLITLNSEGKRRLQMNTMNTFSITKGR